MPASQSSTFPIIALPWNTVLLPGRSLHISPLNRPDVIALIARFISDSSKNKTRDKVYMIGCVPLKSPLLSADGQRLIDDGNHDENGKSSDDNVISAKKSDLFNYGTLAKVSGIQGRRGGDLNLVVEGVNRMKTGSFTQENPYMEAQITTFKDDVDESNASIQASFALLKQLSKELVILVRLSSLTSRSGNTFSPILARQLELFIARRQISEAGFLADSMTNMITTTHEEKLMILCAVPIQARLDKTNELLQRQISSLQGNTRIIAITSTTNPNTVDIERLKQMQRDPILKNTGQMPGDQNLSGAARFIRGPQDGDEESNELEELKKRLEEAKLSQEAQKVATRELKRLQKMNPAQAEYQVCRNYLENLAEIPWTNVTEDRLDAKTLSRARKQLDDDHYGLEKIKKRLLEYLAVLKLKQTANELLEEQIRAMTDKVAEEEREKMKDAELAPKGEAKETDTSELQILKSKRMVDKSPILLLVGPPGTGKTSLAKSVATALGRKFHRISLGGVRDEAEIRGHRRTYVAAMPGLIVSGLKKVGVANPVFLLDEIDKVGTSNFHGDPSAAMLEVLDPEQNHTFMDHYVNIPLDLSRVLFIATANTLDTIPPPLLDRMETISLSGYTTLEKRHIAARHLLPKQIRTNAMQPSDIQMDEEVIDKIITSYTRESGVRNLERELGSVCRYKAVEYADVQDRIAQPSSQGSAPEQSPTYSPVVKVSDLEEILGIDRFDEEIAEKTSLRPGVVTGLVAYSTGGQGSILFIEIADMPGTGRVQLTGKLGDVLKESVEVALTWVKSHAFTLGLTHDPTEDIMKNRSIHVHCPQGAVPKDGPSAGLAHTVALISLFSGKAVPPTLAMTGEISLRGKVTPVGGIKEKLIGALRAGVKTVLLPVQNRKEAKDLPQEVKDGLEIVHVGHIWEALRRIWPDTHWAEPGWSESRL